MAKERGQRSRVRVDCTRCIALGIDAHRRGLKVAIQRLTCSNRTHFTWLLTFKRIQTRYRLGYSLTYLAGAQHRSVENTTGTNLDDPPMMTVARCRLSRQVPSRFHGGMGSGMGRLLQRAGLSKSRNSHERRALGTCTSRWREDTQRSLEEHE